MVVKPDKNIVAIIGGGNCSHIMAGVLNAYNSNITVRILTRRPNEWGKTVTVKKVYVDDAKDIVGKVSLASDDPAKVIPGAGWIIVSSPVHPHEEMLNSIATYISDYAYLGTIFAQGGFDWKAKKMIAAQSGRLSHVAIFGCQHIPWSCRTIKYGNEVAWLGVKQYLNVCLSIDASDSSFAKDFQDQFAKEYGTLCKIPVRIIGHFLNISLVSSNQIIHPGRLWSLFEDYKEGDSYGKDEVEESFYLKIDDKSANTMQALSDDILRIKAAIKQQCNIDLKQVRDLGERIADMYGDEVTDKSSLKAIMSSNTGWKKHTVGYLEHSSDKSKVIPDFTTRYMWDDIPFGLVIIKSIAEIFDVKTPTTDKVILWAQKIMKREYLVVDSKGAHLTGKDIKSTGACFNFGFTTKESLVA